MYAHVLTQMPTQLFLYRYKKKPRTLNPKHPHTQSKNTCTAYAAYCLETGAAIGSVSCACSTARALSWPPCIDMMDAHANSTQSTQSSLQRPGFNISAALSRGAARSPRSVNASGHTVAAVSCNAGAPNHPRRTHDGTK